MALTAEELQQVEKYLAEKGIDCDTKQGQPSLADLLLSINENGIGQYVTIKDLGVVIKSGTYDDTTWHDLELLADADKMGETYEVGTAFMSTMEGYDCPFLYIGTRDFVGADGVTMPHRTMLMPAYITSHACQFSQYPAFYYCSSKVTAGTYYVHFSDTWGNQIKDGQRDYKFTLTKDVGVGYLIGGFRSGYSAFSSSQLTIYVYQSDGITISETVTAEMVTDTSGLTLLCDIGYKQSGDVNDMRQVFQGCNDWDISAIMQWLNSTAKAGKWWAKKGKFDLAPSQLSSQDGFLSYLPEELRAVMKTVQVKTWKNTINNKDADYSLTYCKAFLPSLEEMYIVNQKAGEGSVIPYWKDRVGLDSPRAWYQATPELVMTRVSAKTSANWYRLRSASRGSSYSSWNVYSSGYVNYNDSFNSYYALPIIVI